MLYIRIRRHGVSLRTQLMVLLGVIVAVATVGLGSIAYRTSHMIAERATIREVGTIATSRKQLLVQMLRQQRVRAEATLKTLDVGCSSDETWCLRKILLDFVASEGAAAARLDRQNYPPVRVGKGAEPLARAESLQEGYLARFIWNNDEEPFYILQVTSLDRKNVLSVRGSAQVVNQIFGDGLGLGQSGETMLIDSRGYFLTKPRYQVPNGATRPLAGEPIQQCLAGKEGELLSPSYRGVPAVYGFRSVPEIGGGCVVALFDQVEVFAPMKGIQGDIARVSTLLALMAVVCSFLVTQLVSRPLKRLAGRTRSLQRGDFDSPVVMEGPSEVRMFARTFEAMALSLKASRAALEHSTEHVRNILESISDGFAAFDREWRCTYVNARATELMRIPQMEVLNQSAWKLFPGLVGTHAYDALQGAMGNRVAAHLEEYCAPFGLWFELDAYPTHDGLAVFGRDVTDRKQINARLQQTQRLESLGLLAGGIAHDFNNLLTGIIGNASVALEEVPENSQARKSMEAVVAAGERAGILTRQLLAYAGKGRFVVEQTDLSELVREISSLIRTSIPRNVTLQLDLADDLPPVEADPAQIQQLIMNLVMNAAESSEDGRAEIVIIKTQLEEVDEPYLTQTLPHGSAKPGTHVSLEVRDRGCGMTQEILSRIFDPFFTTKFTGRGLGLAAVMGIVQGHKAALKVDSAPGNGSSFKVLFPASQGVAIRQVKTDFGDLRASGTILIVDDEETVRKAARSALESYGYSVVEAADGDQGIECFKSIQKLAAVLLDMTMPVMSGEQVFTKMRELRPEIPIVLSSGYDEDDATQRFAGKLSGFLQKPYTSTRLAAKIKSVIGT